MNQQPDIVEPDEMLTLHGDQVALWGQCVVPQGEPFDPVPSVYASRGEIETSEYRFDLDEAERYAARILNAVRWQRAKNAEQRAAELNAMATGAAATHDWRPKNDSAECSRCHCVVRGDEFLSTGVVPPCGTRCPMQWHDIGMALSGDEGDAVCIHCKASWSATHLYVLMDAEGRILAAGPYLTFDQAIAVWEDGSPFVPMKLARDEALAAVAESKHQRPAPVTGVSTR